MPRAKLLSLEERAKIDAFLVAGWSLCKIAKALGRSWHVVCSYQKDPVGYGTRLSRLGRPKMTTRNTRRLLRAASAGRKSAQVLAATLKLPIQARQVRTILRKQPHLEYKKRKAAPRLTRDHKLRRVSWASDNVTLGDDWTRVIFSDEKKFNLDGPDGWQYYWHDLRQEEQIYSQRQNGGGSVMIWAAFSSAGRSQIAFLDGRQDSAAYINTLQRYLLPFANECHEEGSLFQQDNASIHRSQVTIAWMEGKGIDRMEWPALSPDLNPIENLWSMLARRVYAGGRQYTTRRELKDAIEREWDLIPMSKLTKLVSTMPKRCIEVLKSSGAKIAY